MINVALLSVIRRWHLRDGMSTRATDAQTDDDVVMDTIRELLKHMDDKTRSMILITAWALRETQGLQAHKLDLPTLRRALMLNLDHNS